MFTVDNGPVSRYFLSFQYIETLEQIVTMNHLNHLIMWKVLQRTLTLIFLGLSWTLGNPPGALMILLVVSTALLLLLCLYIFLDASGGPSGLPKSPLSKSPLQAI